MMMVSRITLLSLLLWMAIVPYVVTDPGSMDVKEHSSTELTFNSADAVDPGFKKWYKGYYNDTTKAIPTEFLVGELYEGDTNWTLGKAARKSDMTLAGDILTINNVLREDDGYFTCETEEKNTSPRSRIYSQPPKLQVYRTPTLTLLGLEEASYNVSDDVTVSCTLVDAYPDVDPSMFSIVWEEHDFDEPVNTTAPPPNKYYNYKIEKSFTLTKEDNMRVVNCSVQLKVGPHVKSDNKTLNVNYFSGGKPDLYIEPGIQDEGKAVKFTCDDSGVFANPKDLVKWYRRGAQYKEWANEHEVVINNVSKEDSGIYSCSIGNSFNFSVQSNDKPLKVKDETSYVALIVGAVCGVVVIVVCGVVIVIVVKKRRAKSSDWFMMLDQTKIFNKKDAVEIAATTARDIRQELTMDGPRLLSTGGLGAVGVRQILESNLSKYKVIESADLEKVMCHESPVKQIDELLKLLRACSDEQLIWFAWSLQLTQLEHHLTSVSKRKLIFTTDEKKMRELMKELKDMSPGRSDHSKIEMSPSKSNNLGSNNQGAEYSEIGPAAMGRGKSTPGSNDPGAEYSEIGPAAMGGGKSTLGSNTNRNPRDDIPTYAEVNNPQTDIPEYAEVKKPQIVTAPPGTEGLMYIEVNPKRNSGKKGPGKTRQAPNKQEPTEYADIDQIKSGKSKSTDSTTSL